MLNIIPSLVANNKIVITLSFPDGDVVEMAKNFLIMPVGFLGII